MSSPRGASDWRTSDHGWLSETAQSVPAPTYIAFEHRVGENIKDVGWESKCCTSVAHQTSGLMCAISSINSLDLLILRLLSVPERLDLLCRADREVALRAAARYIDLLLHHHECVHVCVYVPLSYCYRRVINVQRVTCITNDFQFSSVEKLFFFNVTL